eukprot:CAMPEP_0202863534 /NCGR_PEP_ID=MMETSP1391-20130828/4136_1 /ASSEMBLY_ACC=CAM_ASM_000867 /TAXON_ID=1034604 /ORGANISM="Chlamydomonas leiostraca, Strain SAG 11-49" /LENGTH=245 /DNA_ID=CAMNT_0049543181 /DNA_START=634 /DNA_END=1372 /DNA_ORIENTATION=-
MTNNHIMTCLCSLNADVMTSQAYDITDSKRWLHAAYPHTTPASIHTRTSACATTLYYNCAPAFVPCHEYLPCHPVLELARHIASATQLLGMATFSWTLLSAAPLMRAWCSRLNPHARSMSPQARHKPASSAPAACAWHVQGRAQTPTCLAPAAQASSQCLPEPPGGKRQTWYSHPESQPRSPPSNSQKGADDACAVLAGLAEHQHWPPGLQPRLHQAQHTPHFWCCAVYDDAVQQPKAALVDMLE